MDAHTCLLIGNAGLGVIREDLQSRVSPKPKAVDVPKVEKALAEALNDIVCFTYYFKKRNIEVAGTLYSQGVVKFTKAQVIDAIGQFFRQKGKSLFWIMYSGHGGRDTGDWSCYDGLVSFQEVMHEWECSGNMWHPSKKLFIFADCCYSGVWKETLKGMSSVNNVAIQATCRQNEVAYDGVLTKVWIHYQDAGSFGPCSCTRPGSQFCYLRSQHPTQHVAWRRHLRGHSVTTDIDNDITESFGVTLIKPGTWDDW